MNFSLTFKGITKDYTRTHKKKQTNNYKPKAQLPVNLNTVYFRRSCPQIPSARYYLWKTAFDVAQTARKRPEESLSDL